MRMLVTKVAGVGTIGGAVPLLDPYAEVRLLNQAHIPDGTGRD